ncbi:chemotaxis protein CheW [Rhodoferax sp.]|jgi:twitching motility protein PilI|uniref:chemotaxis protein CheW n=1 Tax=Rhodoferax sp. TaxID=50421 RepID=UPI0037850049
MANREALRELQARLATRFEAAQSIASETVWLAVQAGGANYLLPLVQSGEIFSIGNVHRVPHTQAWFFGVVNLRGNVYAVVQLATFLAGNSHPGHRPAIGEGVSAITLNPALELNCALQVDALCGLRGPEVFHASDAPATNAAPFFGRRFMDANGVQWQEIDLRALAQSPEFLDVREV